MCISVVQNVSEMAISHFRVVLFGLFCASLVTILFYISNTSQIENVQGATTHPLVFQEYFSNKSDKILLTLPVYIERKEKIEKVCNTRGLKGDPTNLYWENKKLLDHIIVDVQHELLYCYVPKVACTNWKRIFMILTGKANSTNVMDIPANDAHGQGILMRLSNYTSDEIEFYVNTFTKFLFVRHPFERLLSAYRNKLEQHYLSSQYFQMRYGRQIIKRYRSNPSNDSLMKGDDVTFQEFATYITSHDNSFNEHWKPIFDLCQVCLIDYDIVGKYDTLYEDAKFILKQIGKSDVVFPRATKPSGTGPQLKKYYSTLSQKIIKDLYEIYKLDFDLFGYSAEDYIKSHNASS